MDAFAVAVAGGTVKQEFSMRSALRMAAFFGGFQALMPVIGWLAGIGLRSLISEVDHWVAFGLLASVGGKMIHESFKAENPDRRVLAESLMVLLALSVATSIDALAVGISFSFLDVSITAPAALIGVTTFWLSLFGVYLGARAGHFLEKKVGIIGGVILIGIGVKILIEHLSA